MVYTSVFLNMYFLASVICGGQPSSAGPVQGEGGAGVSPPEGVISVYNPYADTWCFHRAVPRAGPGFPLRRGLRCNPSRVVGALTFPRLSVTTGEKNGPAFNRNMDPVSPLHSPCAFQGMGRTFCCKNSVPALYGPVHLKRVVMSRAWNGSGVHPGEPGKTWSVKVTTI